MRATVSGLGLALALGFSLSMCVGTVPALADPATCAWEWGGVAEATPAPCDEPPPATVVEPGGSGVFPVELVAPTPVPVEEVAPPPEPEVTVTSTGLTDDQETTITWGLGLLLFFVVASFWLKLRREG